jgi:hypothetical protein
MAWLLAALLVLPVAARTIHLCEEEYAAGANHTHHDCSTCAICHFAFSAFTEAEFTTCDAIHLPAECKPTLSIPNKPYSPTLFTHGLRAPPFV